MLGATAACHFLDNCSTSALQVARDPHVPNILSCKCPSRYSGVQFYQIQTSKSGPELRCFVHFDLQTCFSPQRRAILRHLKLSRVLRDRRFFSILTCKCASRHSGVQFFLSPLTTWLRTRRFSEPTFRPSRHTNH